MMVILNDEVPVLSKRSIDLVMKLIKMRPGEDAPVAKYTGPESNLSQEEYPIFLRIPAWKKPLDLKVWDMIFIEGELVVISSVDPLKCRLFNPRPA